MSSATPSATDQVITILQQSTLPIEAQGLLLTIFAGEVGDVGPQNTPVTNPWATEVGYTTYTGSLDTFPTANSTPPWNGIPVAKGLVSTALGSFQITHTTWTDWITLPNAPQDFNPPSQCALAWLGAQHVYNNRTSRTLLTDLQENLLGNIQYHLLSTWPGGMIRFPTKYPKFLQLVKSPIPPPTPPLTTISVDGTATDNTGAKWTFTGTLTKVTSHITAAIVGAGSVGYIATQQPQSPEPIPTTPIPAISTAEVRPIDYLAEFQTCCRTIEEVTRVVYKCRA